MRARAIFLGAAAAALLVAGYAVHWHLAAAALQQGLADAIAALDAAGYRVEGEPETSGFPLAIGLGFEATVAAPGGLWEWRGRADFRALPWRPAVVEILLAGRHELSLGAQSFVIDAAEAQARVELAQGAPRRMGALLSGLWVAGPAEPALGREIARLEAVAELALWSSGDSLARWRDRGGTVEVSRLALSWGPLALEGDGTLALDSAMRPLAAFSARLAGGPETVERLAAAGLIAPMDALGAKIALAAMTIVPAEGGAPYAQVPVTLQDGYLYLGPARLLALPGMAWD